MSDVPSGSEVTAPVPVETPAEPKVDKREQAERVIGDIVRLAGLPVRVEVKEVLPVKAEGGKPGLEGGISVALFLEGELPAVQPGRRSHLVEAIQFLANKIVNRPQTERKWISVGVGGHPEPRPAQAPRAQGQAQAAAQAPVPGVAEAKAPGRREARGQGRQGPLVTPVSPGVAKGVAGPPPEETMEVSPDPGLEALGRELLTKAAKLGRYYAVAPLKAEDRARMLKGAKEVQGASVKVEGEGRNRRLVFVPDKPVPMPKRDIPDYGGEEV